MHLDIAPNGFLQIDGARIAHRNFEGVATPFNREGDRNFSLIIDDQEIYDALIKEGWNIKIKPPRDEDEEPFMFLKVNVKCNDFGPIARLVSGRNVEKLTPETLKRLDRIRISSVDLDIRPYDWEFNGKSGRSAYLQSIVVHQRVDDRFAARYEQAEEE